MECNNFFKFCMGFLFITFLIPFGNGRKCFFCTTVEDEKCLHLQKNSSFIDRRMIIHCNDFCTIRRQEYADIQGGVAWLNRSCEPDHLDSVSQNGYFITYLRSCKQNFCNAGDGKESFGEIIEDLDDDTEAANYTLASSSQRATPFCIFYLLFNNAFYFIIFAGHANTWLN